jgi:hypothetical protein
MASARAPRIGGHFQSGRNFHFTAPNHNQKALADPLSLPCGVLRVSSRLVLLRDSFSFTAAEVLAWSGRVEYLRPDIHSVRPLALGALSALTFRTPVWRELFERYASKLSWVAFARVISAPN